MVLLKINVGGNIIMIKVKVLVIKRILCGNEGILIVIFLFMKMYVVNVIVDNKFKMILVVLKVFVDCLSKLFDKNVFISKKIIEIIFFFEGNVFVVIVLMIILI